MSDTVPGHDTGATDRPATTPLPASGATTPITTPDAVRTTPAAVLPTPAAMLTTPAAMLPTPGVTRPTPGPAAGATSLSAVGPAGTDLLARRQAHRRAIRAWRRYAVGLTVAALVIAGFVAFTWAHGEIRHVQSRTTAVTATALPGGTLRPALTQRWHSADQAAIGTPVDLDVVTTYGGHTVSGRDAFTGKVRWSYTRTDRRLCAAAAQPDVVVAVYAHDGICDEATGLDPHSGTRNWTRTLFGAGAEVSIRAGSGYFLFVRPGSLNLLRSNGTFSELDAWNDVQPAGCTTGRTVLGTSGVLFESRCQTGDKLVFRAWDSGDKRSWTVAAAGRVPLGADNNIVALGRSGGSIEVLAAKKGSVTRRIPLTRSVEAPAEPYSVDLIDSGVDLVGVGGGVVALSEGSSPAVRWQRSTGRLSATDLGVLQSNTASVTTFAPLTGAARTGATVVGLVRGARLAALGTGLLADAANGVSAYR